MKAEKELAAQLRRIKQALPETFFAHLPLDARVEKLVSSWQHAVKTLNEIEAERSETCDICGNAPYVIIRTDKGNFCQDHYTLEV